MKRLRTLLTVAIVCFNCCVEGGIFLKAKDPLIHQDAVWIYSNSTAITSIAPDVPANKFTKSITPLENLPFAKTDGVTGVLYNREDSCSTGTIQQPIPQPFYEESPMASKVPKIALVKKQEGRCSIFEKILNAQLEGAIGVVLYDTMFIDYSDNPTLLDNRKKGVPIENNLKIPAFHVDHSVGKELYYQLEKMAGVPIAKIPTGDVNSNLTTRISVRVRLFPADNLQPTAWELTLLVMIVILATSIIFSAAMHVYMWKKGKKLQETVERNHRQPPSVDLLPMGKPLLSVARLHDFPTRTIDTLPDEEERKKVENVLSDEKQIEALINTTALSPEVTTISSRFRKMFRKKSTSSPSTDFKITTHVNNMCVICLEAFKIGDEVRELPCHHEFHCVCIDPWLTSKSGECPLCKFDCSVDPNAEKIQKNTEDVPPPKGIRGLFEKLKSKHHKRSSVLPTFNPQRRSVLLQQQQQENVEIEAPGSPGLRAALRAIEAAENASRLTTSEEIEPLQVDDGNNNDINGTVNGETVDVSIPISQSFLNSGESEQAQENDEIQPRPSTTSTVTYSLNQNGDLLPAIDVEPLPLFDIDLLNNVLDDK